MVYGFNFYYMCSFIAENKNESYLGHGIPILFLMKFEVGASEEFFDSRLQRKKPTMRKWEKT